MGLDFGASELAAASLIAGGVGTGVSALGAIQSSNATAAEAQYQSEVASNNAKVAEQNREYAAKAGQAQAQQVSLANSERVAQARAAAGAGYLDPNSGSPLEVQISEREKGQLSTANTVQEANLAAYGYANQATNFLAESRLQEAKAEQAPIAGAIGATGSLLQGASSIGSRYAWMQTSGLYSGTGGF